MTKVIAVKEFKRQYADLYINRVDYWTAQLEWSIFIDTLCREGKITPRQYNKWLAPFKYGRNLSPTKAMLERKVYHGSY